MGLLKNKRILIDSDFTKDTYFSENQYFKTVEKNTFPTISADIQLKANQPVFYSINNVLNRLLDNDRYIQKYISSLSAQTSQVTRAQVIEAFKQDITTLNSDYFEEKMEDHLLNYHEEAPIKLSSIANTCLKADFSNFNEDLAKINFLNGVDLSASNSFLANDIVVEVEFNDSTTKSNSYILAAVCNKRTGNSFKYVINGSEVEEITDDIPTLLDVPFIYRRWLSGLKEFFIYLPTTFTFYNEGYGRPTEIGTMHNLNEKATWIMIKMNKRHFNIKHVYSSDICPQSLPMQIHNDRSYQYFSDIIQPSIVRSLPISISSDNNTDSVFSESTNYFAFYFTCYGTDAQAIRIIAD